MSGRSWTSADDRALREEVHRQALLRRLQEIQERDPEMCQGFVSENLVIRPLQN